MGLSHQKKIQIYENNKKISDLLKKNEEILKQEGFKPPARNFTFNPHLEHEKMIQVPPGYIRTKEFFIKKYGLLDICNGDMAIASNIAYSLEASDFNNFIFNRFGIYGSILAMMYKQATINIISIIEVLIKTYVATISEKCHGCPRFGSCSNHITKSKHIKVIFKEQVDVLQSEQILIFDDPNDYQVLKKLYEYRNYIHLTKAKDNELTTEKHSKDKYNEAITMLKKIDVKMKEEIKKWNATSCSR